ncbi:MAG TPA: HD domain-containing protein [Candidatus Hydrogenedentes bacterium]|nr:HD domain-containing protein [Candidatus Hydrogenedentota bacterium]
MTLITRKTTPATPSGTLAHQPPLQGPLQFTDTAWQRYWQARKDFRWLERTANNRRWPLTSIALPLACQCHHNQYRRTGEPYLAHPLRVARTLYTLGVRDDALLAAALLHDTVEDASMTEQYLRDILPRAQEMARQVCALTKRAGQSLDDYFAKIGQDGLSILIKMADRCDNLASMNGAFTPERMKNYLTETEECIQPLCAYGLRHFLYIAPFLTPLFHQMRSMMAARR